MNFAKDNWLKPCWWGIGDENAMYISIVCHRVAKPWSDGPFCNWKLFVMCRFNKALNIN